VATCGAWIASRWRPGLPRWSDEVKSMLSFGGHVTGFTMVNFFVRNLDNVLIGRAWGAVSLGFYAKAYQLLLLPIQQINQPLSPVAFSTLSRLRSDPEAYRRAYLRMLGVIVSISMPAVAAVAGCADWVIVVLLGPRWEPSAHLYAILSLAAIVQPVGHTIGWLFLSQGRARMFFKLAVILAPVTIGGFFAGLPWGAAGVAWSYAVTEVGVRLPVQLWAVGREGPVRARDIVAVLVPWGLTSLLMFMAVSTIRTLTGTLWSPLTGLAVVGVVALTLLVTVPRLSNAGRETHRAWVELLQPFINRLKLRRAAA